MGEDSGPLVWRVADHVRKVAVVAAGFFLFLALVATAVGLVLAATALMWIVALLVIVCVWRWYLVPYVVLSSDWLVVQGAFAHRVVPCRAIREARPGLYGVRIKTTDGRPFVAWAVQKSKFADWFHRQTRADEVVAEIMQRAEHHPSVVSMRMAHGTESGAAVVAPAAAESQERAGAASRSAPLTQRPAGRPSG